MANMADRTVSLRRAFVKISPSLFMPGTAGPDEIQRCSTECCVLRRIEQYKLPCTGVGSLVGGVLTVSFRLFT